MTIISLQYAEISSPSPISVVVGSVGEAGRSTLALTLWRYCQVIADPIKLTAYI